MRRRVKVIFRDEAWRVDLPSYQMVPGSWLPVIPGVTFADGVLPGVDPDLPALAALTCMVDFPDDIANPQTGRPDHAKIRALYRGQPRWDKAAPPDV
jgi:hypothetical protein